MSYTPTTWTTGDTITATAMNKIENGIASAGGGGSVFYEVTTTNFPNSNNQIGYFAYIKDNDGTYTVPTRSSSMLDTMFVYGNNTCCEFTFGPVPSLENYYYAFFPNSGVTITSSSGGIAGNPVVVSGSGNGYIVTGDFTASFEGWL